MSDPTLSDINFKKWLGLELPLIIHELFTDNKISRFETRIFSLVRGRSRSTAQGIITPTLNAYASFIMKLSFSLIMEKNLHL